MRSNKAKLNAMLHLVGTVYRFCQYTRDFFNPCPIQNLQWGRMKNQKRKWNKELIKSCNVSASQCNGDGFYFNKKKFYAEAYNNNSKYEWNWLPLHLKKIFRIQNIHLCELTTDHFDCLFGSEVNWEWNGCFVCSSIQVCYLSVLTFSFIIFLFSTQPCSHFWCDVINMARHVAYALFACNNERINVIF